MNPVDPDRPESATEPAPVEVAPDEQPVAPEDVPVLQAPGDLVEGPAGGQVPLSSLTPPPVPADQAEPLDEAPGEEVADDAVVPTNDGVPVDDSAEVADANAEHAAGPDAVGQA